MRWEKIQVGVGSGGGGGEDGTSSGSSMLPGKRWGHTCNSINGGRFLYVFGGYGRDNRQTNQLHVFDTAQQTWTELVARGTPPIPRDSHTCTTVDDNLFVFGGTDGRGPLKDLHIFDTCEYNLLEIDKSFYRIAKRKKILGFFPNWVEQNLPHFLTRSRIESPTNSGTNTIQMMIRIGLLPNPIELQVSNTWITPSLRGEGPGAREGHSATLVGKRLFIFGGCGRSSSGDEIYYNDVYILNTETYVWRRADTTGTPPCQRDSHTCSSWKNQVIVVAGEDTEERYLSDVHILDAVLIFHRSILLDTLMWKELRTTGPMLPPRASHTTVAFGKNLFVFGGFTDGQNLFNDLYMLDVEAGSWTKLTSTGDVPSRRFSVAGDCIHPSKSGVLAYISGCDENLEAIDDMYYLHTGYVQDERKPERLSLKKQLKLKCQEQYLNGPVLDKALFSINPMGQPVSFSSFNRSGRENVPLNLAAQTFNGKKTFQAKVTEAIPRGGYTIETVIDGKPLRGILFAKIPSSLPMANSNTSYNNKISIRKRKYTKTSRVEVSTHRSRPDGVYGKKGATSTPDSQNLAHPEPETVPGNATLPLPTTPPMIFRDDKLNDGPSSGIRASEESPTSKDTDTLSPNQDEMKPTNGEH
ncbi:hypothetical protein ACFE04_007661 [Oxalis oulophora]